MAKVVNKLVEKAKAAGIENAEEIVVDLYKAVVEAVKETASEADTDATEKLVCNIVGPVLDGFKSEVEKLADLNKDGKIGN